MVVENCVCATGLGVFEVGGAAGCYYSEAGSGFVSEVFFPLWREKI